MTLRTLLYVNPMAFGLRHISTFTEYQILSISNDTVYLTCGGFIKLLSEAYPVEGSLVASGITGWDTANWKNERDQIRAVEVLVSLVTL